MTSRGQSKKVLYQQHIYSFLLAGRWRKERSKRALHINNKSSEVLSRETGKHMGQKKTQKAMLVLPLNQKVVMKNNISSFMFRNKSGK